MTGRKFFELLAVVVAGLMWSLSAWGQATTSLRGTVLDPSGAAIPQAEVTVTNLDTNLARHTRQRKLSACSGNRA